MYHLSPKNSEYICLTKVSYIYPTTFCNRYITIVDVDRWVNTEWWPFFTSNLFLLFASLRLKRFGITFFAPLLNFIQWLCRTLLGSNITSTSNFSKMPSTVPSRSLFTIVLGMPLSSKHSRLDYWLLLHVCHSRLTNFSLSLVFTSSVIDKSDLSCTKSYFESESSFLIPGSVESNLLR